MSQCCTQALKTNSHSQASVLCLPMSLWGKMPRDSAAACKLLLHHPVWRRRTASSPGRWNNFYISSAPVTLDGEARLAFQMWSWRMAMSARAGGAFTTLQARETLASISPTSCLLDSSSFDFFLFWVFSFKKRWEWNTAPFAFLLLFCGHLQVKDLKTYCLAWRCRLR